MNMDPGLTGLSVMSAIDLRYVAEPLEYMQL
jgi:hypothetical protein